VRFVPERMPPSAEPVPLRPMFAMSLGKTLLRACLLHILLSLYSFYTFSTSMTIATLKMINVSQSQRNVALTVLQSRTCTMS
jgi:hypothetical protein